MIFFSTCYGDPRLVGVNDPNETIGAVLKQLVVQPRTVQMMPSISGDDCNTTGREKLKSRKRWVRRGRGWFVNAYGFLRSLALLMCFAWCVVLSGIAFAMFSLTLSQLLVGLFPLPVWVLVYTGLFVILVAPNSHASIECSTSVQSPLSFNTKQTIEHSVIHRAVCIDSGCILGIIAMLLLMSGDVESNPGPRDRNTDSNQPSQSEANEPSTPQPEDPQPLEDLPRKMNIDDSETLTGVPGELGRFASLPDCDDSNDGSVKDITTRDTTLVDNKLVRQTSPVQSGPDNTASDNTASASNMGMGLGGYQPTSESHTDRDKYYQPTFFAMDKPPILSPRRGTVATIDSMSRTKGEEESVQEAITDWQKKSDEEKMTCCITFDEVLIKLFLNLTRLYRAGRTYGFCPLCFEIKKKVRQSHIIPECILMAFRLIHVPVRSLDCKEDYRILYNFSSWSRFPPRKATVELLCENCETKSSDDENKLKSVYLYIMSNPDIACQIEGMENGWLHRVLAHILFRGILVNVDLDDYHGNSHSWFEDGDFLATFTSLWNYCKNPSHPNPPDLRLFLLPNKALNDETTFSMFSMERILRSPHYTEIIIKEKIGVFLYTKFDCFHVVLPVDGMSRSYFNTYRNGLYVSATTNEVFLRQCIRPRPPMHGTFSDEELTSHFPAVLLQWNIQLHDEYAGYLFNQPSKVKIRDYDIPFNIFPGELHKHDDSDTHRRMNKADDLAEKAKIISDLEGAKKINLGEQDNSKATEDAAKISPLTVVMILKGEYEQVRQIKAKLHLKENELQRSTEERRELQILLSKAEFEMQTTQDKLWKEQESRRVSEISLQMQLLKRGKRTEELIVALKKSHEDAYKQLSMTAHKDKRVWEDTVARRVQETEYLLATAKDLNLVGVTAECEKLCYKYQQLRFSRMHSQ